MVGAKVAAALGLPPKVANRLLRSRSAAPLLVALREATAGRTPLDRSERELVLLRALHNAKAEEAFARRAVWATDRGLGQALVGKARVGAVAPGLTERQAALIVAADELNERGRLRPAVRARLGATLQERELLEVAVIVGLAQTFSLCEQVVQPGAAAEERGEQTALGIAA